MSVTLDHWREWKQRCAVEACDAETRTQLNNFLKGCALKAARVMNYREYDPKLISGAHLLDVHIAIGKGKRRQHKDWLFQRSQATADNNVEQLLNNLNVNVALLVRTALRDLSANERHDTMIALSRPTFSLQTPIRPHSTTTYEDLINAARADTVDTATEEAFRDLAGQIAPEVFNELSPTHRIILAALMLELPLSDEGVLKAAERGKSTLAAQRAALAVQLETWLMKKFPEEDAAARFYLLGHVTMALAEQSWENIKKSPAGLALSDSATQRTNSGN